jgi:hypothetical protein
MFDERKTRRELRNKIDRAKQDEGLLGHWGDPGFDSTTFFQARQKVNAYEYQLDLFETERLLRQAQHYGIQIPPNPTWWVNDSDSGLPPEDVTHYLNNIGQSGLKALILEHRKKNWEFWVRVITALTGLGGTLIGIISALKR